MRPSWIKTTLFWIRVFSAVVTATNWAVPQSYITAAYIVGNVQRRSLHQIAFVIIDETMAIQIIPIIRHGFVDRSYQRLSFWCVCDGSLGCYLGHQGAAG